MASSPGAAEIGQLYSAAFKAWAGLWTAWQDAAIGLWKTVAEWATEEQRSVAGVNMKEYDLLPRRACTLAAVFSSANDMSDAPLDIPPEAVLLDPPAITPEMVQGWEAEQEERKQRKEPVQAMKGMVGLVPGPEVPFGGYRAKIVDRDDPGYVVNPLVNVNVVAEG